jgi:hypothetical protein
MKRLLSGLVTVVLVIASMAVAGAQGYFFGPPVTVPITVTENATYGTYNPMINLGLGSMKHFPIVFDTGSTGLRLFAVPQVGEPGSGTVCSQIPTSVTYGNPGRITYTGVVCYGYVRVGSLRTTQMVPFALLTSASCPPANPHCTIVTPQEHYAKGDYGVFGASLSLGDTLPNPLRMLPGAYGERFAVRLMPSRGDLVLGGPSFKGVPFPLVPQGRGMLGIPAFRSAYECVFVKDATGKVFSTGACPEVVYDTGNDAPVFYANIPGLSVTNGYVTPGTDIGFSPSLDGPIVPTLVASTTYTGQFRVDPNLFDENLINVGIEAFLGNQVGFDAVREIQRAGVVTQGVMTIAPL